MRKLVLTGAGLAASFVLAVQASAAPAPSCGTHSAGPGALRRGDARGPACLLAAYAAGCRPASYELSVFGVDTIATSLFSLERRAGRCEVAVASTFEVVPRLKTRRSGVCAALHRAGADVLASGCTGGIGTSLSLSGSS